MQALLCMPFAKLDGIGGHGRGRRDIVHAPAVRSPEPERAAGEPLELVAFLVDHDQMRGSGLEI